MAEKEVKELSIVEQAGVLQAVYSLIDTYPELNGVETSFESQDKDSQSLGVFGMQGSIYLQKYISGDFEGLLQCFVRLRSNPKSDKQRMNKLEFLEKLGIWLETTEYPPLTDKRKIIKIELTSMPFKDGAGDNGHEDYILPFRVIYFKKGF